MNISKSNKADGFTILELVISLAVGVLILSALISAFILQRERYDVQEKIKVMDHTARAAMDIISREVGDAGYNPTGDLQQVVYPIRIEPNGTVTPFVGIPYNASVLEIVSDLNGDGDNLDTNERIQYRYDSTLLQIQRSVNPIWTTDVWVPFAENIENFAFNYFEADGVTEVTDAGNQKKIRLVKLSITARADQPDADFSENDGYRYASLLSNVKVRNLGLETAADSTSTSTTTVPGATTSSTSTTSTSSAIGVTTILYLTTVPNTTSTTTTTGLVSTTVPLPTDCTVHIAVGSCITANNNGDVLLRVHILDATTQLPIENATVNWYVLDMVESKFYKMDSLRAFYNGWYGGVFSCICTNDIAEVPCASSNPTDDKNAPDFKAGYFKVFVEVIVEGCGGGIFKLNG